MGTLVTLRGQQAITSLLSSAASKCRDFPEFRSEVGKAVQEKARATVRKKTRRLEGSITLVDTGVAVHVFTDLRYAWPVHAGVPTERMAPNRFLLPLAYELDPAPIWDRLTADLFGR